MNTGDQADDAMLRHIFAEVQRAIQIKDPLGRAAVIAEQIQPYSGWALRWAIEECRLAGIPWTVISAAVHRPYPTLLRQLDAGGPVYVVRPAHSHTGNFDGQTPLRRAAFALANRFADLMMTAPGTVTGVRLADAVRDLSVAQGMMDNPLLIDPAPLLDATGLLLTVADAIAPDQVSRRPQERAVWEALAELRACYSRDRGEIEAAHQVLTEIAEVQPAG